MSNTHKFGIIPIYEYPAFTRIFHGISPMFPYLFGHQDLQRPTAAESQRPGARPRRQPILGRRESMDERYILDVETS